MRTDKDAQGRRNLRGTALQTQVYQEILDFLERTNLSEDYEVIDMGKQRYRLSSNREISPDLVIRRRNTHDHCVRFGLKRSFRERWKQDDRDVLLALMADDEIPWFEIFQQEYPEDSLETTRAVAKKVLKESHFRQVVSVRDADGIRDMWNTLRNILKG